MILIEETATFLVTKVLKEKLNDELAIVIGKINSFYTSQSSPTRASAITVPDNAYFEYTMEEKVTDSTIRIIILPSRKIIPGLKQTLSASTFPIEVYIAYDYSYEDANRYLVPERIREAAMRALKKGLALEGLKDYYLTSAGEGDVIDNKNNRTTITQFEITLAG